MKKKTIHIGSSLDDFLNEEGILEQVRTISLKGALAWQVHRAMRRAKIKKPEMARRMRTSRAALARLLDPENTSVTLQTGPHPFMDMDHLIANILLLLPSPILIARLSGYLRPEC